jgi:hypothetical protein
VKCRSVFYSILAPPGKERESLTQRRRQVLGGAIWGNIVFF